MKCYTLIPRVSGTIKNWIELLPHIEAMGFNTIHLLPITEMGRSKSPYASVNLYAIDPSYSDKGTSESALDDFNLFVEIMLEKKMKLCVDVVLNHLSVDHNMLQTFSSWAVTDQSETDGMKRAGWSDGKDWHKWEDLILLDYEKHMGGLLWSYMLEYAMYWAGFAAKTNGYIRFDNLHSAYIPFAEYVHAQLKIKFPQLSFLSEMFTDENHLKELVNKYQSNYLLATQWEHKMAPELREYLKYVHSDTIPTRYFMPVLTHDSGSLIEEYGELKSGHPRMLISALMSSGGWGIVQGTEHGLEQRIEFIGEKEEVAWYKKYENKSPHFGPFISTLNSVLKKYEIFSLKGNIKFLQEDHHAVISAIRFDKEDNAKHVFVFANLDIFNAHDIVIHYDELKKHSFNFSANYYDILSPDTEKYMVTSITDSPQIPLQFAPGEIKVLVSEELRESDS